MKKIKLFLGAYLNCINAQNLNCVALAKYLDPDTFELYAMQLYSCTLPISAQPNLTLFKVRKPFKWFRKLGYLWGIMQCDIAYLPKGEEHNWTLFWLRLLNKPYFRTVEIILDDEAMHSHMRHDAITKEQVIARYNDFKHLYSITPFMQRYNASKHGINATDTTLYLGTEIDTFLYETEHVHALNNILMIGNDLIRKGFYDFIEIAKTFPSITFNLIGSGNNRIDVAAYLHEHQLNNVIYHGSMNHQQLATFLKTQDLLLFPSRSEGFPKVILECAAAGVPSMLFDDYGANEWIEHGKNGFVHHSLEAMKDQIATLQDNPETMRATSKAAIAMAKTFDWNILIQSWEAVIKSIIKESV